MILGPRYKICRRLGSNVFEKCQTQRYTLSEAKHAQKARGRRGTISDFGKQLLEKQRIRFSYGIHERQLRRYIKEAGRRAGGVEPSVRMLELLETRLDNVVFRTGIANSRRQARQLVSHGHITVNGRKVTIPSYQVTEKDTVGVREGSKNKPFFEGAKERYTNAQQPSWLSFDASALTAKMTGKPNPDNTEAVGSLNAVLEFYSR